MRGEGGGRPPNTVEKVLAKVDRSGGPDACWPWTGYCNSRGYGEAMIERRHVRVHRVAWEAEHGPIPDDMLLCHRCDNPPCCNPAHHFIGTSADNNADMKAKGRARGVRGTANAGAKLTADQVRSI